MVKRFKFFSRLLIVLALIAGPAQASLMETVPGQLEHSHELSHTDKHVDGASEPEANSCCHPIEVAHSCFHQVPGALVSQPLPGLTSEATSRLLPECRETFPSKIFGPPHRPPIHIS